MPVKTFKFTVVVTVPEMAEDVEVTRESAKTALEKCIEIGINDASESLHQCGGWEDDEVVISSAMDAEVK